METQPTPAAGVEGVANGGGAQPAPTIEEAFNINAVPSEIIVKFRKEVKSIRVGLNLECFNCKLNDYEAKLVLKPANADPSWKIMCRPVHGDVQLLSKKVPVTKALNLQVGVRHNFHLNSIGWHWKLTARLGEEHVSVEEHAAPQVTHRSKISLFPGFDVRIGWKAEYTLPKIPSAEGMATGEPAPTLNTNYGRLNASVDRIEAIWTGWMANLDEAIQISIFIQRLWCFHLIIFRKTLINFLLQFIRTSLFH